MSAVAFDTLKFAQTLEAAGIPQLHAEAFSTAFRDAQSTAEIATKADIREASAALRAEVVDLRNELKAEITDVRNELKGEIADVKAEMRALELRMTVKLGAMMVVAIGVMAALAKIL